MSDYIHMKHGDDSQKEELLKLLNLSFGFNENENFETLLPKLYKDEYHPAKNNIILDVNEEMRAAVGVYYDTMDVCGEKLKLAGIGNVAVHPNHRRNGYMQFCMLLALDEMKQNMTDLSALSGGRQRYGYFGYEPMGIRYNFLYKRYNHGKTLGSERKSKYQSKKLTQNDTVLLKQITEIYKSRPFSTNRTAQNVFDVLCSWSSIPYCVVDDNEVKGWFALSTEGEVNEFFYKNSEDIPEILLSVFEVTPKNEVKIGVPAFDTPLCKYMSDVAEWQYTDHAEQFNIFCYEKVIRAFLNLKATYTTLTDGELILFIAGSKLPEQIKIKVRNNIATVEETDEKPDCILNHKEALQILGALYCEKRNSMSPLIQNWFPLPIYGYNCDAV